MTIAKPTEGYPDFAMVDTPDPTSGQPNVATPGTEKKNVGWVYNEKPPRQYFNWLARVTSKWIRYFDGMIDNIKASTVANDSSVTGTTVKDALETLVGEIPVGTVFPYMSYNAPNANYLVCDGSSFNITTYPALYALLSSNLLPDLQGRFIVGRSGVDADYSSIKGVVGEKTHALIEAELPAHAHSLPGTSPGLYTTYDHVAAMDLQSAKSLSTGSIGSGTAHENRPPYYVVNYIIRAK